MDAPKPGPLERAANDKKCQAGVALFEDSRFFCNPATSPGNTVTRSWLHPSATSKANYQDIVRWCQSSGVNSLPGPLLSTDGRCVPRPRWGPLPGRCYFSLTREGEGRRCVSTPFRDCQSCHGSDATPVGPVQKQHQSRGLRHSRRKALTNFWSHHLGHRGPPSRRVSQAPRAVQTVRAGTFPSSCSSCRQVVPTALLEYNYCSFLGLKSIGVTFSTLGSQERRLCIPNPHVLPCCYVTRGPVLTTSPTGHCKAVAELPCGRATAHASLRHSHVLPSRKPETSKSAHRKGPSASKRGVCILRS